MALQSYASDTMQSGGRGSPNVFSPASDGDSYTVQTGAATQSIVTTGGLKRGTLTGSNVLNLLTLDPRLFMDVDQYVTVSVSDLAVKIGLIGRYTNNNNYYRCDWAGSNLEIFTNVNGTGTTIKTQAISGFTPAINTFYRFHFRIQGFGATGSNPNNLMANIYPVGSPEPAGWMIQASDPSLFVQGNYGYYYKATLTGQSGTFDSYTVTDCPAPTIAPAYTTPATLLSYGATMYVPNNSTPPLPSQTIIDMIGTCSLGTNTARATGLNKGSVLRYQMRWKNVETYQINGTSYYDWAIMDDAVQKANYWGFGLMWPVQAPPDWQKARDALGSSCTLAAAPGGGNYIAGTAYSSINVTALPNGAYIPHKSKLAINWNNGTQENVFVWDTVPKVYQQGATSINISSTNNTFTAWTPGNTHVVGEVVWEATNNGTGGPVWAKSSAYVAMCSLVATRYNGISGYGKLDILQVENEDYDTSNRIGGQGAFGANGNSPGATDPTYKWDGSSTWDNGGAILAPVYTNVRNAVKLIAGMSTLPIFPCSVRKTPNTARQHIINWVTGFVTKVLANGGNIDGLDFHSYRDGTFTVNADGSTSLITDPAISTYMDANHVTVNAPAISLEVADIKAVCAASNLNPQIMCGENGWPIYDDGNGVQVTLDAKLNTATTYTSVAVDDGTGVNKATNQAYNNGGGPYSTLVFTTATGVTVKDATPIYVDNTVGTWEVVYAYGQQTTNTTLQITTRATGQAGGTQLGWNPATSHAGGVNAYIAGGGLPANIVDATPIYIDYTNPASTETTGSAPVNASCFAWGTALAGAYSIAITTNSSGHSAAQVGLNTAHAHAPGIIVYGENTTVPITTTQHATYYKEMYDGMRLGGANYCFMYTMDSIASIVHSGFNPQWSGRPDGVTQIISGVYTYEPAYLTTGNDSDTFGTWGSGPPPPPPVLAAVLLPATNRRSGAVAAPNRRDGTGPFTKRRG